VIELSEFTVKLVAGVEPNETALAPVKPVPVTVTVFPPTLSPEPGDTPVTVGAGRYVYWSAGEVGLVTLPSAVTPMSTVPTAPGGTVAVIWVAEFTV
jgi:hypothetical protein